MKISYDYTITLTRADVAKIVTDLLGDQLPKGHVVLPNTLEAHCAYDYSSGYDIDFKVGPPPAKKKTAKKKITKK